VLTELYLRLIRNYGCVSQLEGGSCETMKKKTVNLTAATGHALTSVYTKYTHYGECLHSRSDTLAPEHVATKTPILLTRIHGAAKWRRWPRVERWEMTCPG
jgi:hypothetical protein